ncbi:hypothetical protein [Actinoplanes sp. NPDC051851]|uniref:hypothetical protein n=1 Tax=Actinoplanes sp. NPDC051851 TaxID=3154753 RepID=UPI003416BCD3
MAGYWGATADPHYGYSPYSGQLHYGDHPQSGVVLTEPPGEGNGTTIEAIGRRFHNMHPERIAALAEQWQNSWTLLNEVRSYVLARSEVLEREHWRSPGARDAFLRMGPGTALAYLDVWMDAAQNNVTTLRHLVNVTADARRDIDDLLRRYEQKLREAQSVNVFEHLGKFLNSTSWSWSEAEKEEIRDDVRGVTADFTREAQALAHRYGDELFEYIGRMAGGVGPPVRPMNAVLDVPGGPGGPSSAELPPGGGSPAPPPTIPVAFPADPGGDTPAPENPPAGTGQPSGGPDPGGPQALPEPPVQAAELPPGLPVLPPGLPSPVPGNAGTRPPGLPPGAPGSGRVPITPTAPTAPLNPGQLGRGSFGRGKQPPPGFGQPPGRMLRRSGHPGDRTPPPPVRPSDRRRGEERGRVPGTPAEGEETVGRPSGRTAPPVLGNPQRNRARRPPGSTAELHPAAPAGGGDPFRPEGAAPPVLNRPVGPGTPPQPARRRETPPVERSGPAWADFFGAERARSGAGSGTVEAPSAAHGPRPGDVAPGLRNPAASGAPPETVAPELSRRRTTGRPIPVRPEEDEERGIVTDEQAFDVPTPGGGVVTNRREDPGYEPEIKRALGGGR